LLALLILLALAGAYCLAANTSSGAGVEGDDINYILTYTALYFMVIVSIGAVALVAVGSLVQWWTH
jgi:hypothetical protein